MDAGRVWRSRGTEKIIQTPTGFAITAATVALPGCGVATTVPLYDAITTALEGRTAPIAGRDVAEAAGVAYKAAIDALGRMLDAGTVVRYGRKRSSTWALTAAPAGATPDPLGAVEAAWRARPPEATPTPTGGGGRSPPASRIRIGPFLNFFAAIEKANFFQPLHRKTY